MRVPYELRIIQVKDGTDYKGHIKLGESTILFKMLFATPIPELNNILEKQPTADDLKRFFQVTLGTEEAPIALTDEEYKLFLELLLMKIVEFYDLPQTRDANETMTAGLLNRTLDIPGISMEFSEVRSGEYEFPQMIVDMLNHPKFNCALAA